MAGNLAHAADKTGSKCAVRYETDTGGLEWAEGDRGKDLCEGGRGNVYRSTVVAGGLVAELVDALLLEKLVTTELEGALEEVAGECGSGTGQESASALVGDDLSEAADHATVVGGRVELNAGLDAGRRQLCLC